jgi:pyridoxamine 5'-phosphate oxidase
MVDQHSAPFYDDLGLSLAEAARLIGRGARDRNSPAHCPVVATIDAEGAPSQRIMILRELDWDKCVLRFHTDSRSTKVDELSANNSASVLFYDPETKIQLRLQGSAAVETDSSAADEAWKSSTPFARRCYLAEHAPALEVELPTSGLPTAIEGKQPEEADLIPGRPNFAILLFSFDQIEWLYLANSGHRRARWRWDSLSGAWQGRWQIP